MKQPAVAGRAAWPKVVGVGLACAALLPVSACGSAVAHLNAGRTVPRAGPPAGVVPWVDRPAPPFSPPPPRPPPSPPPAKYAPCTAAELTGRPGVTGVGAGNVTRNLVFTNTSGRACTLAGGPREITGVRRDGRRVRLVTGAVSGISLDYGLLGPANLQPGQSAQVVLHTTDMCPKAIEGRIDNFIALEVGIQHSGAVRIDFPPGQPYKAVCGVNAYTFGVALPPAPKHSSPLDVLTVTRSMPRRLTAGTTASYTVTLRNPTSHPVALRPCPSYLEFVQPIGTKPPPWAALPRYYLNCQAAPEIPAHRSVTFAMRVPVPAISGRARSAKYGWMLQDTGVETGGAVTVAPGGLHAAGRYAVRCLPSQLRLAAGPRISEATQQNTLLVVIRNVSATKCDMRGYPRVALIDRSGARLPFRYRQGGDQMLTSRPPALVPLAAGAVAYVAINKNTCVTFTSRIANRLELTLPGDRKALSLRLARYPILDYCGVHDPGHTIDITPVEPNAASLGAAH